MGDLTFNLGFIAVLVGKMVHCPLLIWQMVRATLERVTRITVVFVFNRFIDLLILYVFPNLGFI